jgi:predicted MFS family arabinose efflux permease
MPKAKLHWTYDLFAVALVGAISGLVFWLAPPAEPAKSLASLDALTRVLSTSMEYPRCSVVDS